MLEVNYTIKVANGCNFNIFTLSLHLFPQKDLCLLWFFLFTFKQNHRKKANMGYFDIKAKLNVKFFYTGYLYKSIYLQ